VKSGGPWLKLMLNRIGEWQLEHPNGTKTELVAWIKAKVDGGEFKIPAQIGLTDGQESDCKRVRLG
jgi:tRNA nucleotidyltransferase (CCA-adding enzyme)